MSSPQRIRWTCKAVSWYICGVFRGSCEMASICGIRKSKKRKCSGKIKWERQYICPWCGSDKYQAVSDIGPNRLCSRCSDCKKCFEICYGFLFWYILSLAFLVLYLYRILPEDICWILGSFCFIWGIISSIKMPVKRMRMKKEYTFYPEQLLGVAQITWFKYREGGLCCPRFTVWNHYILPICFVNKQGMPISQVGYTRINRIWFRKEKRIMRITDNYRYDPAEMKEFVIFYNRRIVARGRMV